MHGLGVGPVEEELEIEGGILQSVVPQDDLIILYSHATVFVCPSIYEPFGIINLEAMACGTPVVGSAVGGIPEVVVDNETGVLVPIETISPHSSEPKDPRKFSNDLATAVNHLMSSSEKLKDMGVKARERVERIFSWRSIARQTLAYYRDLVNPYRRISKNPGPEGPALV